MGAHEIITAYLPLCPGYWARACALVLSPLHGRRRTRGCARRWSCRETRILQVLVVSCKLVPLTCAITAEGSECLIRKTGGFVLVYGLKGRNGRIGLVLQLLPMDAVRGVVFELGHVYQGSEVFDCAVVCTHTAGLG